MKINDKEYSIKEYIVKDRSKKSMKAVKLLFTSQQDDQKSNINRDEIA